MARKHEKSNQNSHKGEKDANIKIQGMTDEEEDLITEELLVEEFAIIHG